MKVYICSAEQPPKVGGAGMVATRLLKGLPDEYVSAGLSPSFDSDKNSGFSIIGFIAFVASLLKAFFIYDRIILNDLFSKKVWLTFFRWLPSSKLIVYLHGSEPEYLLGNNRWSKRFNVLCVKSHCVVAVSNYMYEKFLNCVNDDFKIKVTKKLYVVRNGICAKHYNITERTKYNRSNVVVFSASRLVWEKGYKEMLEWLLIQERYWNKKIKWIIAGEGKDSAEIKNYLNKENKTLDICFLGPIDEFDMIKYYQLSDIFLQLSKLKESLGLVYMEAALCGCWSVGPNRYGAKEAIINGQTGSFVSNKMLDIYSLPSPEDINRSAKVFSLVSSIQKIKKLL